MKTRRTFPFFSSQNSPVRKPYVYPLDDCAPALPYEFHGGKNKHVIFLFSRQRSVLQYITTMAKNIKNENKKSSETETVRLCGDFIEKLLECPTCLYPTNPLLPSDKLLFQVEEALRNSR